MKVLALKADDQDMNRSALVGELLGCLKADCKQLTDDQLPVINKFVLFYAASLDGPG